MRLKLFLLAALALLAAVPATSPAKPGIDYRVTGSWGGPGAFSYPNGIDTDSRGNVFVADSQNHRIIKYSPDGKRLAVLGDRDTFGGWVNDVEVGPSGDLFAAVDTGGVVRLSQAGEVRKRWGEYEGGAANRPPGALLDPSGIAIGPTGDVFVSDRSLDAILVYSAEGTFREMWTGEDWPLRDGRFEPFGLDADRAGFLYIANGLGASVIKATTGGSFIKSWGRLKLDHDWKLGLFQFGFMVEDVATGPDGSVFASDFYAPRVHRFGGGGRGIVQWRTPMPERPQVRAITVAPKGQVYVLTDHRVYRYRSFRRPARPSIQVAPRVRTKRRFARFRFGLGGRKANYQCRLAGVRVRGKLRRWRPCGSPRIYRNLRPGKKLFRVRAVVAGEPGPPATHRWRVLG